MGEGSCHTLGTGLHIAVLDNLVRIAQFANDAAILLIHKHDAAASV